MTIILFSSWAFPQCCYIILLVQLLPVGLPQTDSLIFCSTHSVHSIPMILWIWVAYNRDLKANKQINKCTYVCIFCNPIYSKVSCKHFACSSPENVITFFSPFGLPNENRLFQVRLSEMWGKLQKIFSIVVVPLLIIPL